MNRKANRTFEVLALAAMLLAGMGCRNEGKPKPSKMMGPLYSYQSLQTVEKKIDLKAGDWDVLEDRRPLSTDKRPPFRMFTISHKNWVQWRNAGDLQLTFYNDRLMIVRFYPMDLEMFKGALSAHDEIGFSQQGDTWIDPSTRVWIGKDDDGKVYVGWIDKALQAEMDQWIKKYS
jgi:hypothetical protein